MTEDKGSKRILKIVLIIVVALLVGVAIAYIVFVWHPWKTSKVSDTTTLVNEVGKHLILPTDEAPGVGTVTNPAKISSNSFLKQAHKGDRILIYAKRGWIIIYRPSADKIVDIGRADVSPPSGSTNGFTPIKSN
jgi:hypothetical protein